jgi:protein involved in polysaccharide export with SLBB domain
VSAQSSAPREASPTPGAKSQSSKVNPASNLSSSPESPVDKRDSEKRDSQKTDAVKRVDKVAKDNAQRHYKAGVKYGRANLYRQALESFEQAIKYDPGFSDAYYGLGHANMDLGRYSEAVAAFEKVIKLDPGAIDAFTALGQAYAKLKEEKQSSKSTNTSAVGERVGSGSPPERAPAPVENTDGGKDQTRIYRVGVGDVLDIRVAGSTTDESTLFTVSSNGQVEHPILGHGVKVSGLTTEEISELIGSELKRRSIRDGSNPEVGVRDYNSHTILVSGLVKEPGTKILRREAIPLYVVLADAQPLPEASVVVVISQQTAGSQTIDLANPQQTSILIRPGDVITVQPPLKQFFYIGGEVKSPGELPYRPGLSLTQAILTAGGVTPRGQKVQLTRGNGNGLLTLQEFKLKDINKGKTPDPVVEPGDRITVLP